MESWLLWNTQIQAHSNGIYFRIHPSIVDSMAWCVLKTAPTVATPARICLCVSCSWGTSIHSLAAGDHKELINSLASKIAAATTFVRWPQCMTTTKYQACCSPKIWAWKGNVRNSYCKFGRSSSCLVSIWNWDISPWIPCAQKVHLPPEHL